MWRQMGGTVAARARIVRGRDDSKRRPSKASTIQVGHDRLELSANGLRVDQEGAQSEGLRDVATARQRRRGRPWNPACFSVRRDDSSRNVTETGAERTHAPTPSTPPSTDAATDVERALVRALDAAAAAGRFDVVAQLARELEARRLACARNVVRFEPREREPKGR